MIHATLASGNTSLASRKKIVEKIGKVPDLIPILLRFTFDSTSKVSVLASIVLDDLVQQNPVLLDEHIRFFVGQLSGVEDESVKRLTSKLAVLLLEKRRELIEEETAEQLWNQSLVWLTSKTKVATEANAMQIVMILHESYPEQAQLITEIIALNVAEKTPAYQSKARKLIRKINKRPS